MKRTQSPKDDRRQDDDKGKPDETMFYIKKLSESISELAVVLCAGIEQRKIEFEFFKAGLATKQDLEQMKTHIMSAISEFAAKQNAFNDRQASAVDGLVADVAALNKKIEDLQNSPGGITPEDQALLNEIEARSDAITTKLEALDSQTPPTVPS